VTVGRGNAGLLVRQALRALAQRKGRTALTSFSIAIGIAAVLWVVAIGKAGQGFSSA
jgi:hypothetical protein